MISLLRAWGSILGGATKIPETVYDAARKEKKG